MTIPLIVWIISVLIWLFPPFKQRKTEYFWYFLILAITDPLTAILNLTLSIKTIQVNLLITFCLILALSDFSMIKKNWIIVVLIFLILVVAVSDLSIKAQNEIKILLSFIVLFIILKNSLLYFNKNHTINLFFLIFILYEITIITKFMFSISETKTGVVYFYTTSFFEYFIGIYFSFFNVENSPKFKLIKEDI